MGTRVRAEQMPTVATHLIDGDNFEAVRQWIQRLR